MIAIGTRVTAILEAKDGIVKSFGDGVYAGDFDLPPDAGGFNFGQKNPRIDLDSGKTVWGCESWWGPCEAVRKRLPADWKWETVDIEAHRKANAALTGGVAVPSNGVVGTPNQKGGG